MARRWADLCLASPALVSATALCDDGSSIAATWLQRDVVAGSKRSYAVNYMRTGPSTYMASAPVLKAPGKEFVSPSRRRMVRFVEKDADSEVIVEVWALGSIDEGPGMLATWKVPCKIHGPVYADEWFGGVAWSPDENLFIYVADRPSVDSKGSPGKDKDEVTSADSWNKGLASQFNPSSRDPLGEAYVNRRSPALYCADVNEGKTQPMCLSMAEDDASDFESEDMSSHWYGDPQWSADGRWVAVTRRPAALEGPCLEDDGIADKPHDLGVSYCYNRYASIEILAAPCSLNDASTALSDMMPATQHSHTDDFCCTSPRFSPDSNVLVYVSAPRKELGRAASTILPHGTTKVLRAVIVSGDDNTRHPTTSSPVTVLGVVQRASRDKFPGLYLHALPLRPWLGGRDSRTLVFTSGWGSDTRALTITLANAGAGAAETLSGIKAADVSDVTPALEKATGTCSQSVSVLDVCASGALMSRSSPLCPPQIVWVNLSEIEKTPTASSVSQLSRKSRSLISLGHPYVSGTDLALSPTSHGGVDAAVAAHDFVCGIDDDASRYQVTLIIPRIAKAGENTVPLIVFPHGGPHVSCINGYAQSTVALLDNKMAVMYVNYRGSTGLGQESLESLPGNAGTADVSEVLQATQWALQTGGLGMLDKDRVGYVGGSHGGFLGAHVSTVPGNLFKRIALRNPVVNIASMIGVTDIPEWAFCEAGCDPICSETGLALSAGPTTLKKMWKASPVARVLKGGCAPGSTVLFVGGSDKRVPPEQSIEWKRLITEAHGAGIVTMRWYKDSGHSIDEVPSGDDVMVHTLEFLSQL
jgi:acylaminoacyl-peptidase